MAEREFRAKYDAPCKVCSRSVKGQLATWVRTSDPGKKGYVHIECWQRQQQGVEPVPTRTDPLAQLGNTCADCGHELGSSIVGSGRSCDRCQSYHDAQQAILTRRQEQGRISMPTNGTDATVLNMLGDALWSRIESRVKQVESSNDDLAAKVDAQLESLKSELAESVTKIISIEVVKQGEVQQVIDNAHSQLPYLINLMSRRKNVYLWDATGGGKSYAIPQAAEALSLRYASQSYNSQSPDYLITGYNDANGKYVPSLFYDFFKGGGVYTGEELDDGSADLLVTLNVALANHHMTFPNRETVKRHPDFIFVGCGNTAGRGPTPRYPERKPFDAAFANRFIFVRWLYDTDLEKRIASSINPNSKPYVKWVSKAREVVTTLGLRLELTPRTTFNLAELSVDRSISDSDLLDGVLAGLDETAKAKLLESAPFPTRVSND